MNRLPYVDVLRGVAILQVMLLHLPLSMAGVFGPIQSTGGRGVDLFFVLSGFLIASTCLARVDGGATPVRQALAYWVLRIARIWPLYFLLLGLFYFGAPFIDPTPGQVMHSYLLPYLFFYSNDIAQPSLELGVLWSLAIEEQFYFLVGGVLFFAARDRPTLTRVFAALGVTAIVVALRFRTDLIAIQPLIPPNDFTYRLNFSTLARADQLAFGVLAATLAPSLNTRGFMNWRLGGWSNWLGVCAVVAIAVFYPVRPRIGVTMLGVSFAAMLLWLQRPAATVTTSGFDRVLQRIFAAVGGLSFGLYMLHPITRHWVIALFEGVQFETPLIGAGAFLLVWMFFTFGLALLSQRYFEEPILRWARRTAQRLVPSPQVQQSAKTNLVS